MKIVDYIKNLLLNKNYRLDKLKSSYKTINQNRCYEKFKHCFAIFNES